MSKLLLETEEMTKEELINELKSKIDLLLWEHGIERLRLVETFGKNLPISTEVEGLKIEIEDNIAYFSDIDGNIFNDCLPAPAFLVENVVSVKLESDDSQFVAEIGFSDGSILIERVEE